MLGVSINRVEFPMPPTEGILTDNTECSAFCFMTIGAVFQLSVDLTLIPSTPWEDFLILYKQPQEPLLSWISACFRILVEWGSHLWVFLTGVLAFIDCSGIYVWSQIHTTQWTLSFLMDSKWDVNIIKNNKLIWQGVSMPWALPSVYFWRIVIF